MKRGASLKKKSPHSPFRKFEPWIIRAIFAAVFIGLFTLIVGYARGYRFNVKERLIMPTGILAITSSPQAAKVYVNGALKGVTDLNLTLPADKYTVEVKKDGYTDWKQDVTIKGEIVISLDAVLFPKNPSLSPLTSLGIAKAVPIDQTDRVLLFSQTGDPLKDGVYIFDVSSRPLSLFPPLKLILLKQSLPSDIDFTATNVYFDPEFSQAIVEFNTANGSYAYLLSLNQENTEPFDVSASKSSIIDAWNQEKNTEILKILETFPRELRPVATESFRIVSFSPDKNKILYQAKSSFTLPRILIPPMIGSNQNTEERSLIKDGLYIYDKKEDKNFAIPFNLADLQKLINGGQNLPTERPTTPPLPTETTSTPVAQTVSFVTDTLPILWYPDSRHLGIIQEKEVLVIDYDGSNRRTLYAGPFEKNFFLITKEARLLMLTNLNPQYNNFPDMYEVGAK